MDTDTLIATYEAAWQESNEQARLELLTNCWAENGIYQDPSGRAEGRDALSAHIAGFHKTYPGARIEVTSAVQSYDVNLRFNWHMRMADGTVAVGGVDFGQIAPDGQLARITGFFGDLTAVPG